MTIFFLLMAFSISHVSDTWLNSFQRSIGLYRLSFPRLFFLSEPFLAIPPSYPPFSLPHLSLTPSPPQPLCLTPLPPSVRTPSVLPFPVLSLQTLPCHSAVPFFPYLICPYPHLFPPATRSNPSSAFCPYPVCPFPFLSSPSSVLAPVCPPLSYPTPSVRTSHGGDPIPHPLWEPPSAESWGWPKWIGSIFIIWWWSSSLKNDILFVLSKFSLSG